MKYLFFIVIFLYSLNLKGQIVKKNGDNELWIGKGIVFVIGEDTLTLSKDKFHVLETLLSTKQYNLEGETTYSKELIDIIPSSGTNFTIDINIAGFTSVPTCVCTASKANVAASAQPIVQIDAVTISELKLKVIESKTTSVTVGGTVEGLENSSDVINTNIHFICKGN